MKIFILLLIQVLSSSTKADFYYPNCESVGISCLDCYTQKYCLDFFVLVHWSTTNCASLSGSTPYCDPTSNTCTNVLPSECTALSFYNCLRDGVFPDLTDCSFHYRCTNDTSEELICPENYVYKQEWGKCVYQLNDADCVKTPPCTLLSSAATYPGDASLYYQCEAGALTLAACAETEEFNLESKTCESVCKTAVDGTTFANTRDCQSYYVCEGSNAGVKSCDSGYGFNSNTNECEWGYQNLCNELAILDDDVSDAAESIPVYGALWAPVRGLFRALKFNPLALLLAYGVSDNTASTAILIGDYVYKNQALPSSIVSVAANIILPYLPEQIRTVVQSLLQLGLLRWVVENNLVPLESVEGGAPPLVTLGQKSLGSVTIPLMLRSASFATLEKRRKRSVDDPIRRNLEDVLRNVNPETLAALQGKTPSQALVEILRRVFKIPEAQLPLVLQLIQLQLPLLSKELNKQIGLPLFKVQGGKLLKIDVAVVDLAFNNILGDVAQKLYPENRFLAEMFKAYARQLYFAHHDVLVSTADVLQLSFEKV